MIACKPSNRDNQCRDYLLGQRDSLYDRLDHVRLPFAYKLHLLLNDMESNGCEHIISWVEDGNAFKIHDQQQFEELIQPHYFRQSKMSSFVRQCYMYGFSKIERGPAQGSYFHPDFQRSDQAKSLTIRRQSPTRPHCPSSSKSMDSPPSTCKEPCRRIKKTRIDLKHQPAIERKRMKHNLSLCSTGPNPPCGMTDSPCSTMSARDAVELENNGGHVEMENLVMEQYAPSSSSMYVGDDHQFDLLLGDPLALEPRPIEVMIQQSSCQNQWSSCAFSNNKVSTLRRDSSKAYFRSSLTLSL